MWEKFIVSKISLQMNGVMQTLLGKLHGNEKLWRLFTKSSKTPYKYNIRQNYIDEHK